MKIERRHCKGRNNEGKKSEKEKRNIQNILPGNAIFENSRIYSSSKGGKKKTKNKNEEKRKRIK